MRILFEAIFVPFTALSAILTTVIVLCAIFAPVTPSSFKCIVAILSDTNSEVLTEFAPRCVASIIPVAILLGGKGRRLNLKDIPKPMVPFLGKPLLEHLVQKLHQSHRGDLGRHGGEGDHVGEQHRHLFEGEDTRTATDVLLLV